RIDAPGAAARLAARALRRLANAGRACLPGPADLAAGAAVLRVARQGDTDARAHRLPGRARAMTPSAVLPGAALVPAPTAVVPVRLRVDALAPAAMRMFVRAVAGQLGP